jgi:hypothetical protein
MRVRRREALGFKSLWDDGGQVGATDERERKRNISTQRLENHPFYLPATLHRDLKKDDHAYVKPEEDIKELTS